MNYKFPSNLMIFGAKSLALGATQAIRKIYPEIHIQGFIVSSLEGNPSTLSGVKVYELSEIKDKNITILIATPQDIQDKIILYLNEQGFHNHICMDWKLEAYLMSKYYELIGAFSILPKAIDSDKNSIIYKRGILSDKVLCYMAKFYRDKKISNDYIIPDYVLSVQVGAALTDERVCDVVDNIGKNISTKNVNYCELTALYWMWKNCLNNKYEYCGLYQYRRLLDIDMTQMDYIFNNDIDVILPLPTMCEPNISEHHSRYIKESDWEAMLTALEELQPEYRVAYDDIFSQEFMYNYNIMVAKKEVLLDYCNWLFPILERTEELSVPKGSERADRYIGYLGENLMTLYFMYNADKLKIYHTGRVMLL